MPAPKPISEVAAGAYVAAFLTTCTPSQRALEGGATEGGRVLGDEVYNNLLRVANTLQGLLPPSPVRPVSAKRPRGASLGDTAPRVAVPAATASASSAKGKRGEVVAGEVVHITPTHSGGSDGSVSVSVPAPVPEEEAAAVAEKHSKSRKRDRRRVEEEEAAPPAAAPPVVVVKEEAVEVAETAEERKRRKEAKKAKRERRDEELRRAAQAVNNNEE